MERSPIARARGGEAPSICGCRLRESPPLLFHENAMKKHLLVVEDDAHIRLGLSDALRSEGYDVTECCHGGEAVALVRQRTPDLVVLDIMLPGKSGYDLCREIRATKSRVPILMLSAKGQEIDKVVGLELGAADYVTKPFSLRELLARIQALLRRADFVATTVEAEVPA